MKKLLFVLICVSFSFFAFGNPDFYTRIDNRMLAEAIISSMSDAELLGQVFFLGYTGTEPPRYLEDWITERGLGGVKLFTRNVENLVAISTDIRRMQEKAYSSRFRVPLFIATDQEGGWVRQIKSIMLKVPGNLALGSDGLPYDTYRIAYYIGAELSILGININFAPTVDVYSNPENTVIGPRSFHHDPVIAGMLGLAYMKGMEESGVLCTAKHYPGHGDADLDSHGFLPVVGASFATLWNRELIPYRLLVREGARMIMTGHLAFPEVLGDLTPSSLSDYFISSVLKDKLGFEGVVITDDLEMYGARQDGASIPDTCYRAMMAGNDMILISRSPTVQEKTWNKFFQQMKKSVKFKERIKDAVRRILLLKLSFIKKNANVPLFRDPDTVIEKIVRIQETESKEFVFQNACRSITAIRAEQVPFIAKKDSKILLVGQYRSFLDCGIARFPGSATYEYSYFPQSYSLARERKRISRLASNFDTVIFCLANANSLEVLETLEHMRERVIVVSALTPVYLSKTPWVNTAIAVYGTSEESFKAGFAVLCGDFAASGRLPVDVK